MLSSNLWFLIVILCFFVGGLGFLAFGPYTVSVRAVISPQEWVFHFVLASFAKCFKIEWNTVGVKSKNRIVFLWIPISRFSFLKSRENGKKVSSSQKILWRWVLNSIFPWLIQIRSMIRIRSFKIHCTVGTGNPLITGLIYGTLYTLYQKENDSVEIRIFPNFFHKTFSAKGEMTFQFVLFQILWAYGHTLRIQTRRRYGY